MTPSRASRSTFRQNRGKTHENATSPTCKLGKPHCRASHRHSEECLRYRCWFGIGSMNHRKHKQGTRMTYSILTNAVDKKHWQYLTGTIIRNRAPLTTGTTYPPALRNRSPLNPFWMFDRPWRRCHDITPLEEERINNLKRRASVITNAESLPDPCTSSL